jgi:hypothetical protein
MTNPGIKAKDYHTFYLLRSLVKSVYPAPINSSIYLARIEDEDGKLAYCGTVLGHIEGRKSMVKEGESIKGDMLVDMYGTGSRDKVLLALLEAVERAAEQCLTALKEQAGETTDVVDDGSEYDGNRNDEANSKDGRDDGKDRGGEKHADGNDKKDVHMKEPEDDDDDELQVLDKASFNKVTANKKLAARVIPGHSKDQSTHRTTSPHG